MTKGNELTKNELATILKAAHIVEAWADAHDDGTFYHEMVERMQTELFSFYMERSAER